MSNPSVVQLKPFLQPFPYGREGMESWAAQFALATPSLKADVDKDGGIKSSQPYGELWCGGTHKNGPCYVEGRDETLKGLIQRDAGFYLGKKLLNDEQMASQYPSDLPFLFKILSFDKPLPLQCHPDKGLGKRLFQEEKRREGENSNFVDTNAKPEVGVALSPFTAFVGFRPIEQLAAIVKGVPELQGLFQESTLSTLYSTASSSPSDDQSKAVLRSLFYEAINATPSKFKPLTKRLSDRVAKEGADTVFGAANAFTPKGKANASGESEAQAMARVFDISVKTYGEDDVGSIVALVLMNILRLQKGEGAWILADDLHAYVEGDIIECMVRRLAPAASRSRAHSPLVPSAQANSDNMVAHGLGESEMGGISTFVEMLSYRHLPAEQLLLEYEDKWSKGQRGLTRRYKVPIAEFDLLATTLTSVSESTETLSPLDGPLTFIVTNGSVKVTAGGDSVSLTKGQCGFVRAEVEIQLEGNGELWGAFYQ
ncbi:RmlC-like cupin domain-containing protein [Rhodotorula diobovata]|uniref:Mannose-6-phosphate isomerase n=1 Tax=Rhodotorula diobovata TaxID=5288 RepID=A0A5C5FY29_9BASI|nr:RmlC-like cupin domain-containing protein [Rhodotorula diobovata]